MFRAAGRVAPACVVTVVLAFAWMMPAGARQAPPAAVPAPLPSFAEPGLSPDGGELAFVSGGDIWTVPSGGGEARLLVSHPATESRPMYSPSGDQLAFVSTRTGSGDIYVLSFGTGALRRLTFDDGADVARWMVTGWPLDLLLVYESRHRGDERCLSASPLAAVPPCPSPPIATSTSTSPPLRRTAGRWRSRRGEWLPASGGGRAAATSTNRKSGW